MQIIGSEHCNMCEFCHYFPITKCSGGILEVRKNFISHTGEDTRLYKFLEFDND